jgi:hypothetical protein
VTADTVQYSSAGGGGSSSSASNSDSYTVTTLKGTGTGADFSFSSSQNQGQGTAWGTNDLVAQTGTANAISNASTGGSNIVFSTGSYTDIDGSFRTSATSFLATTGSAYSASVIAGSFKADGTQTGGTSYNFSTGGGGYGGFTTSQYTAVGYPTSTYTQKVSGSNSSTATADLSANSDGSANGTLQSHDSSAGTTDTTTTLVGTQTLANGTAVYDNKNHSNDVQSSIADITLQLQAGAVSDTVAGQMHDTTSWDYKVSVKVDLNDNVLHAQTNGSGLGSTEIDDTGKATISGGKPASQSETVVFAQVGGTAGSVTASGDLKDAAGHTGTWSQESSAQGSVNDYATINLTDGKETGRVFHISVSAGAQNRPAMGA